MTTPLGSSDPIEVPYAHAVPGLYTQSGTSCGIGLVNNETPAGFITPNSQENSASPGDFVSVFGTGFGLAGVSLPDGEALPLGAEARLLLGAGLLLGPAGFERTISPPPNTVPPWYKGRAPGLVGIDQLRFQLPLDAPEGCAVPLKAIGGSFKYSQPVTIVTISIRKGGGPCQDPPPSRKGIFY